MSKRHKQFNKVITLPAKKDKWDSELKVAKSCGLCNHVEQEIVLSQQVYQRVLRINHEVKDLSIEWLGYLLGDKAGNVISIDNIIVPTQEVTGASVTVTENYSNERLIGTIHLHPFHNGTWFSTIDDEHIGQNYDVMIVIDPSGSMKGSARVTLECGAIMREDAKVFIERVPDPELESFVDNALGKIKKHTITYYGQNYQQTSPNNNNQTNSWGGSLYCGRCRKKFAEEEMTVIVDSIEYCQSCAHHVDDKDKSNERRVGMKCSICDKFAPWAELKWADGIRRCPTCYEAWREKLDIQAMCGGVP